ncbi:MAG: aminopeptidase P N-terminal domain-containing protein [Leptospira bouyouniensis]|uniref:Xaa-Pro aminopeptidase n=1 Tax=Leptospira bouyouniensis TaxID=2484911 RepID=A0ABY2L348_9LEPT|nr:aminopeptidase P N-terminal domain-containing protein [Leptospira bouyouniensis]TGK48360.1 M24 family metallopeptidase [Leptospira bouyouniensis]
MKQPTMKSKEFDSELFRKRIIKIQKKLKKGEILILFAASHKIRNRDVEYKFRQNSDFYYLTGIKEEDSIFILTSDSAGMFCLPKDKEKEIWTGIRLGKDKIKSMLGLDYTYDLSEWEKQKSAILIDHHTLYYFFGENPERDREILQEIKTLSERAREGKFGPHRIEHPHFLHEERLTKSKEEIQILKNASEITKFGHMRIMRESKPGMYEYELEALLEQEYLKYGSIGGGYGHIVASGQNACILHYVNNDDLLLEGDLVLVDSGAEWNYYTADVTRVFPVGKKFSEAQKTIYEVVLYAQKNAIRQSIAGVPFNDVHDKTVRFLADCLREMGFLKGNLEEIIEKQTFKKFYMHRTGHYLGMDVHDVGRYFLDGKSRPLKDGQVVTVEPGLYFDPNDESIPKEFRGIGIRIEDDILINGKEPINLTESIPKEIVEIEALKA